MFRRATTIVLTGAVAGAITLAAAGAAQAADARPGCTPDIPVKVRYDAGCFHPTSDPAAEPGDATWTPPPPGLEPVPWVLPPFPEPAAEEPAEEPPTDDTPTETPDTIGTAAL